MSSAVSAADTAADTAVEHQAIVDKGLKMKIKRKSPTSSKKSSDLMTSTAKSVEGPLAAAGAAPKARKKVKADRETTTIVNVSSAAETSVDDETTMPFGEKSSLNALEKQSDTIMTEKLVTSEKSISTSVEKPAAKRGGGSGTGNKGASKSGDNKTPVGTVVTSSSIKPQGQSADSETNDSSASTTKSTLPTAESKTKSKSKKESSSRKRQAAAMNLTSSSPSAPPSGPHRETVRQATEENESWIGGAGGSLDAPLIEGGGMVGVADNVSESVNDGSTSPSTDPYEFVAKLEDSVGVLHTPIKKFKNDKMDGTSISVSTGTGSGSSSGGGIASVAGTDVARGTLTDVGTDTCAVGVMTDPDCLGPCEPGTSVILEGIVWSESSNGILVVNVTWRGKTYVGTLMDATRHHWASPRFRDESPAELDWKSPKPKRGATGTVTPVNELLVEGRRLRKGRRSCTASASAPPIKGGVNNSSSSAPAQSTARSSPPVLSDVNGRRRGANARGGTAELTADNVKKTKRSADDLIVEAGLDAALFECISTNCNKKYKNVSGLLYHQSHAHKKDSPTGSSRSVCQSSPSSSNGDVESVNAIQTPSKAPTESETSVGKTSVKKAAKSKDATRGLCANSEIPLSNLHTENLPCDRSVLPRTEDDRTITVASLFKSGHDGNCDVDSPSYVSAELPQLRTDSLLEGAPQIVEEFVSNALNNVGEKWSVCLDSKPNAELVNESIPPKASAGVCSDRLVEKSDVSGEAAANVRKSKTGENVRIKTEDMEVDKHQSFLTPPIYSSNSEQHRRFHLTSTSQHNINNCESNNAGSTSAAGKRSTPSDIGDRKLLQPPPPRPSVPSPNTPGSRRGSGMTDQTAEMAAASAATEFQQNHEQRMWLESMRSMQERAALQAQFGVIGGTYPVSAAQILAGSGPGQGLLSAGAMAQFSGFQIDPTYHMHLMTSPEYREQYTRWVVAEQQQQQMRYRQAFEYANPVEMRPVDMSAKAGSTPSHSDLSKSSTSRPNPPGPLSDSHIMNSPASETTRSGSADRQKSSSLHHHGTSDQRPKLSTGHHDKNVNSASGQTHLNTDNSSEHHRISGDSIKRQGNDGVHRVVDSSHGHHRAGGSQSSEQAHRDRSSNANKHESTRRPKEESDSGHKRNSLVENRDSLSGNGKQSQRLPLSSDTSAYSKLIGTPVQPPFSGYPPPALLSGSVVSTAGVGLPQPPPGFMKGTVLPAPPSLCPPPPPLPYESSYQALLGYTNSSSYLDAATAAAGLELGGLTSRYLDLDDRKTGANVPGSALKYPTVGTDSINTKSPSLHGVKSTPSRKPDKSPGLSLPHEGHGTPASHRSGSCEKDSSSVINKSSSSSGTSTLLSGGRLEDGGAEFRKDLGKDGQGAGLLSGGRNSPLTLRHLHTHHHTHVVGPPYPLYGSYTGLMSPVPPPGAPVIPPTAFISK